MKWLKGLLAALIMAVANAITVSVVDPASFSFTGGGGKKLLTFIAVNALLGLAMYLKQSPLPGADPDARGVAFRNK